MKMRNYKYFYKGVPISEYCYKNNIDIRVIRARIFRFKNKYPDKTLDEIVNIAINYKRKSNEKYYYENMPLSEYCLKHNLNVKTIKSRINQLRKKNPNKTIDEIVDIAINYIDPSKNYYKNMLLTEYCRLNGLNIDAIKSRMFRLKKECPDKNMEQIIDLAINFSKLPRNKYYYQGVPLTQFCKDNNLEYKKICERIRNLKKEEPDKAIEEIIEQAINFNKKTNNKYYYQGIPLTEYCKLNNLSIDAVRGKIRELKKIYPQKSIEQITQIVFENNKVSLSNYYYQGMLLTEYCKLNNLKIETIRRRFMKFKSEYPDKEVEEIIELAVKFNKKVNYKYYYNDIPLTEYCRLNNLNAKTIRRRIRKLKEEYLEKSSNEIIELAINFNKNKNNKYYYQGKTLDEYCKQNEINYKNILVRIKRIKEKNSDLTTEEILELVLNPNNMLIKYNYKGMTLHNYCIENNINYNTIYSIIWRKMRNNLAVNIDEIMDSYNDNINKKKTISILQKTLYSNIDELIKSCNFIGVSYKSVFELQKLNFNVKDSVNIVYFFGEQSSNNQREIPKGFINKISDYIYNISLIKNDKKKLDDNLLLLYKLYKCNLYDGRELIIKDFKSNIYKMINSTLNIFKIEPSDEKIDELYNELSFRLLGLIDSCFTLNKFELLKYILKSLKYRCLNYCFENFVNNNISLDEEFVENKDMYNIIDNSFNSLSFEEELEISIDGYFSDEIKNVINELDKNSLYFIKLKYIYNYDNLFIATMMRLDINEVDKIEEEIISYLRNKPEIISLIYKKEK